MFKRILAALLAASAVTLNAFAFTPFGSQPDKEEVQEEETKKADSDDSNKDKSSGVIQNFKPRDYQYKMFEQILDAYVEKHLYDFTEEEVLHKFFEDFLADNPMYFSYFMERHFNTILQRIMLLMMDMKKRVLHKVILF